MDEKPRITPHNLNLFTEPVTDIYRALEDEIFLLIAKRLKAPQEAGKDHVLQWQIDKMQQLRMFNQDVIKELAKATGLSEVAIKEAISDVAYGTVGGVDKELNKVLPAIPPPNNLDLIMTQYVQQTFREIDNFVNQTLISTNYGEGTTTRMYRKIVEETTGKVLSGAMTVNKAIAETVIKWSEKGIETAFVDKGGNVWSLERYADTVIRSTVNNTYNQLRMSRMEEHGVDLVLVTSHAAARPICARIQGQIASMSNPSSNPEYPSIYDFGYGTPGGIRGIHCKHLFIPYIEGVNTNNQQHFDVDKVDEQYKLTQKQRQLEVQVRKAKRSLKLAEEVGDSDTIQKYKQLVRTRQANVREFVSENNLPRRYDKEKLF